MLLVTESSPCWGGQVWEYGQGLGVSRVWWLCSSGCVRIWVLNIQNTSEYQKRAVLQMWEVLLSEL